MTKLKKISQHTTQDDFIVKIYNIIHTGSCQCHKDCDCYLLKDKVIGQVLKFSHILTPKKQFDRVRDCVYFIKEYKKQLREMDSNRTL